MKAMLATATVIITLFGARLTAADATPTTFPIERQFQEVDVQLAIEQYKKLRMAAFDLELKLQMEKDQTEEQRMQLMVLSKELLARAEGLRKQTIKAEITATANTR